MIEKDAEKQQDYIQKFSQLSLGRMLRALELLDQDEEKENITKDIRPVDVWFSNQSNDKLDKFFPGGHANKKMWYAFDYQQRNELYERNADKCKEHNRVMDYNADTNTYSCPKCNEFYKTKHVPNAVTEIPPPKFEPGGLVNNSGIAIVEPAPTVSNIETKEQMSLEEEVYGMLISESYDLDYMKNIVNENIGEDNFTLLSIMDKFQIKTPKGFQDMDANSILDHIDKTLKHRKEHIKSTAILAPTLGTDEEDDLADDLMDDTDNDDNPDDETDPDPEPTIGLNPDVEYTKAELEASIKPNLIKYIKERKIGTSTRSKKDTLIKNILKSYK